MRVAVLGGDREREHLELAVTERLEDGHRHEHVAVEREAHLQRGRRRS